MTICLAAPTALVSAQEPAPPADVALGQAAAGQDPERAPAPQPGNPPQPATPGTPAPTTPPPPQVPPVNPTSPPDDATAPPPSPSADSSTLVSAAGATSVSILDGNTQSAFRFSPSSITVGAGDTVTWTNSGSAPEGHDVTGSGLGSGTLHNGQSYSHTFASPGTFSYICSFHPFMKGTVTVQAASSGGGGAGGGGDQTATQPTGTSPTAPGSESAAVTSAGAAGNATELPSTGMPLLPLLAGGVGLLIAGALLRRQTRVSQR